MFLFFCAFLGVVGHTLEVDCDDRLIPNDPAVMSRWNQFDLTSFDLSLRTVIHPDPKSIRDLILKMRGLTAFGLCYGLDRF